MSTLDARFVFQVLNQDDFSGPLRPIVLLDEMRIPSGTRIYVAESAYELVKDKEVAIQ